MPDLDKQIREYLRAHPEVKEMLELVKMTEEEYCRALAAYQVPAPQLPTIGSTLTTDVNIPAAHRQSATTAGTA